MFNYSILSYTIIASIFFTSCSNTSLQDNRTSEQLILALNEANNKISQATAFQMKSLEDKTLDYFTKERATTWFSVAKKSLHQLISYINSLIQ